MESALMIVIFFMISILQLPLVALGATSTRSKEKEILDGIIDHKYDNRIRPSGNRTDLDDLGDGPCIVKINIFLRSISKISDLDMEYSVQITFREEWNDERLTYDDQGGTIRYLVLTDPDKIWKPDLFFRNEKEGHFHNIIMPNVLLRIKPDGNVLYSIRISLILSCPMDLKYYPLDRQTCSMSMASYGYTTDDLFFMWKEHNPVQVTSNLHLPRFTLQNHKTSYCTSKTNTGEYSCVNVDLIFKREFSYYLIQIYIPCCMLVIVSWVSFWLDPNAIPARVSLGVTTLLTMATQISGINASLPPVSYTKAIDVWTGSCLTFVFGALLEFALVNYASRSDCHRAAAEKMLQAQHLMQQNQIQHQPLLPPPPALFSSATSFHDLEKGSSRDLHLTKSTSASSTTHHNHRSHTHPHSSTTGSGTNTHHQGHHPHHNHHDRFSGHGTTLPSHRSSLRISTPATSHSILRNSVSTQSWDNGLDGLIEPPHESTFAPISRSGSRKGSGRRSPLNLFSSGLDSMLSQLQSPCSNGEPTGRGHPMMDPTKQGSMWSRSMCRQWLSKFPTRSKRIDVISRIFFPIMFALFNVVYWVTYLWRDDLKDL